MTKALSLANGLGDYDLAEKIGKDLVKMRDDWQWRARWYTELGEIAAAQYGEVAHAAIVQLARKQTAESMENRQLQAASNHLDFAMDFLLSVDRGSTAISIAESFATRWQRFRWDQSW